MPGSRLLITAGCVGALLGCGPEWESEAFPPRTPEAAGLDAPADALDGCGGAVSYGDDERGEVVLEGTWDGDRAACFGFFAQNGDLLEGEVHGHGDLRPVVAIYGPRSPAAGWGAEPVVEVAASTADEPARIEGVTLEGDGYYLVVVDEAFYRQGSFAGGIHIEPEFMSYGIAAPHFRPEPRNTEAPPEATASLHVVSVNVGNVDLFCRGYRFNLCRADVEARAAKRLQALEPDVVLLQEVTPYSLCQQLEAQGHRPAEVEVCYRYAENEVLDQARRLVGWDYTIVCDPHQGDECVAVRAGVGNILPDASGRTCPSGHLCGTHHSDQRVAPYESAFSHSRADGGFVMMYVDVEIGGQVIRVINGHLDSGNTLARAAMVEEAFGDWAADHPRVIVGGDTNLDPYRSDFSCTSALRADQVVWNHYVDAYDYRGRRISDGAFWYHSGIAEDGGTWWPRYTAHPAGPCQLTLDHVVSNFAYGTCATLQYEDNLDGGTGFDHDALDCQLAFIP